MSRENVEVVRGMLRAWAAGDREQARAAYDAHVVFIHPLLDSPVLLGVPAMEQWLESWRRTFDAWEFEVEETIDAGDHVIVVTRQWGTGRESGVAVELATAGVYSLRNRKIIRVETFNSREEALAAAGLAQ